MRPRQDIQTDRQTDREQLKEGKDCIVMSFIICYVYGLLRIMKVTNDDMGTGHSTIIGDVKILRKFSCKTVT